jgi:restriction system protein
MALPPVRHYFDPILDALAQHPEGMGRDALVGLVAKLVPPADRAETTSTGASKYVARIRDAGYRLAKRGFVTRRHDGLWAITKAGSELLEARRARWQVPGADEPQDLGDGVGVVAFPPALLGPEEASLERVDGALADITEDVEAELLERLNASSPGFFERAVLSLLQVMGYGRPAHTGAPGDGGIDGILIADPLGLERVYVQAKRRKPDVKITPGEIRDFGGALASVHGIKGVLATTSSFAEDPGVSVQTAPGRLELIDGKRLAALMIAYGVGVTRHTRVIPEVAPGFFEAG